MKVNKITIKNGQGDELVGILNTGDDKNLIIICNGYNTTKEFSSIELLAYGLNKKGYSVFRFDFSGTGESKGSKKVLLNQQVSDLNSVVNYFKNFNNLILLGGSLGALSTSIVALINPNVTHLITVNGFFGSSEIGKEVRKDYFLYRFASLIIPRYSNDYKYYKSKFLPSKIKLPVLVIYSKKDDIVYPIQSERFFSELSSSKNKKLAALNLNKHDLTGQNDINKVVNSIKNWV